MIYKVTEYQSPTGKWHVGNYTAVGKNSNAWYYIPRMLNMPLTDYILMLRDKYNATIESWTEYDNGWPPLLLYSWENHADAHKFLLMVNKEARARKFSID